MPALLSLWLPLAVQGQVISDSLKAGGNRAAGQQLDKQPAETGGGSWRAIKGLGLTADGVVAEAPAGGHLVIPEIAGSIHLEADVV
ncbi:MAG: hypothetical protein EOP87_24735, partial [Verrucomicrobiaceae bacterium]